MGRHRDLDKVLRPGVNRLWQIGGLALALVVWVSLFILLKPLSGLITSGVFRLDSESRLGSSVGFFLYEAPKLLLILTLVVFVFGVIRSFFSPEGVRRVLARKGDLAGGVLAAVLGVFTPFCSCSAIPLFIGFVEAGVPLGATLSFLIAAPMVNEVAVAMLINMFGPKTAAMYVGTGLLVAVTAGWTISKLRMERYIEDWVLVIRMSNAVEPDTSLTFEDRLRFGTQAVRGTLGRIWPYIFAGIAVGALIHAYVPEGVLASYMGKRVWWSVPAAVAVGLPMYSSTIGIMPMAQALMEKGAALGTVLAFMMAVTGLSFPEMIILRRVLKPQLIATFAGVVVVGILLVGLLFNAVL